MTDYQLMGKEKKQNIHFNCVPFCIERDLDTSNDTLHIHDFHQLTIITRGSGTIVINGFEQNISEGHVYVINNFSAHHLKNQKNLELVNIMFYLDDLMRHADSLKNHHGFQSLFILQPALTDRNLLSTLLRLDYNGICYVNDIIKFLLDEIQTSQLGKEIVVQSYFMILITFLSREYEKNYQIRRNVDQLYKIVAYINNNYSEKITIEKLLDLTVLSERQLRQLFISEYKCTPMQYLINIRMKHACYLLTYSDMSISEISARVGFDDSNYFSRKFKQIFSASPTEYRNMPHANQIPERVFQPNIF